MISLIATLTVLCIGDSHSVNYCPNLTQPTVTQAEPGVTAGYWSVNIDQLQPYTPGRTVSYMTGTNEAFYGLSPAAYRASLEALFDQLTQAGAVEIVIHIPPERTDDLDLNALLQSYTPEILALAAARPDTRLGLDWRTLDLPLVDGVHYFPAGYEFAANAVEATLIPEPSAHLQLAFGLLVLGQLRRRPR